jgi:hypothetical protein
MHREGPESTRCGVSSSTNDRRTLTAEPNPAGTGAGASYRNEAAAAMGRSAFDPKWSFAATAQTSEPDNDE